MAVWKKESWKKLGVKHLVECHCTLKIYQGKEDHLFHKFPVYSLYDENKKIITKMAKCNNCETIHKVYDIGRSEIIRGGKDKNVAEISVDDIALMIDKKIANVLRTYDCDISVWENVYDVIDKEAWEFPIILSREIIEGQYHVKILSIISDSKFKIVSKKIEDEISF